MTTRLMQFSEVAKRLDVSPITLRRWVKKQSIPVAHSATGRLYFAQEWVEQALGTTPISSRIHCALYARESSSENRAALASQLNGLRQYATARGSQIVREVTEGGSGLNDDRKKLHALLRATDFDVLVVEHNERLTRCGFRWFETPSVPD